MKNESPLITWSAWERVGRMNPCWANAACVCDSSLWKLLFGHKEKKVICHTAERHNCLHVANPTYGYRTYEWLDIRRALTLHLTKNQQAPLLMPNCTPAVCLLSRWRCCGLHCLAVKPGRNALESLDTRSHWEGGGRVVTMPRREFEFQHDKVGFFGHCRELHTCFLEDHPSTRTLVQVNGNKSSWWGGSFSPSMMPPL